MLKLRRSPKASTTNDAKALLALMYAAWARYSIANNRCVRNALEAGEHAKALEFTHQFEGAAEQAKNTWMISWRG